MIYKRFIMIFSITVLVIGGIFILVKQLNVYPNIASLVNQKGEKGPGLIKIVDIPLSGGANRLDYQSIDYSTNKLYISHLGSSMVHVCLI